MGQHHPSLHSSHPWTHGRCGRLQQRFDAGGVERSGWLHEKCRGSPELKFPSLDPPFPHPASGSNNRVCLTVQILKVTCSVGREQISQSKAGHILTPWLTPCFLQSSCCPADRSNDESGASNEAEDDSGLGLRDL